MFYSEPTELRFFVLLERSWWETDLGNINMKITSESWEERMSEHGTLKMGRGKDI